MQFLNFIKFVNIPLAQEHRWSSKGPEQSEIWPFVYKNSRISIPQSIFWLQENITYKLSRKAEMAGMFLNSYRLFIAVRFVRIPVRDGIL